MRKYNDLVSCLLAVLSALVHLGTAAFRFAGVDGEMGSDTWPKILAGSLLLLSFLLSADTLLKKHAATLRPEARLFHSAPVTVLVALGGGLLSLILALTVSLTVGAGVLIGYGAVLLILHLLTGKPTARNFADLPFWLFTTMTVGGALLLLAREVGLPLAAFLFAALALALFLWELIACRGSEEEPIQFRSRGMRMVFITCGALGLFALLLWVFGFFPAAALFIPFMMYLMGARRPLTFVLLTVGLLVTVFLVFHLLLGVDLPMGLLFS